MPIELTAHTEAGARLVAIAEKLSPQLACPRRRARPRRHLPVRGDRRAQGRRLLRRARPGRARWPRRLIRARPGRRVEPPGARRCLGRDRREHAPRRGAQHGAPAPSRGREPGHSAAPAASPPRSSRSLGTASCWPPRSASAARTSRGRARSPLAPSPAGGSTAARCSARCRRPPPICTWRSRMPTVTASSAMRTRWWQPTHQVSSCTTTGTRSGCAPPAATRSRSRESNCPSPVCAAASEPATRCRTWSATSSPGYFTPPPRSASPSRPTQIARHGIAERINGDARPRMQVADNAIDLAAARGVLSRAASLIDEHRVANPASDGTADELEALFAEAQAAKAFVNEAGSAHRRPCARPLRRRRLCQRQPARPRLPRRQGRLLHAPAWRQPRLRLPRPRRARRTSAPPLRWDSHPQPTPRSARTLARSATRSPASRPASHSSPRRRMANPPG